EDDVSSAITASAVTASAVTSGREAYT
ncbi:MAG: hypothetical protein QOI10_4282, partial [Solirubrobacterales bacterium]|nr:hypothetical protein [Solirubrobacterales bacterium]